MSRVPPPPGLGSKVWEQRLRSWPADLVEMHGQRVEFYDRVRPGVPERQRRYWAYLALRSEVEAGAPEKPQTLALDLSGPPRRTDADVRHNAEALERAVADGPAWMREKSPERRRAAVQAAAAEPRPNSPTDIGGHQECSGWCHATPREGTAR